MPKPITSRKGVKRDKRRPERSSAPLRAGTPRPPGAASESGWWALGRRMIPALLIGVGLATYLNSFDGSFIFDDQGRIVQSPQIRRLWPPWDVMAHSSRPVLQLSL